MAEILKFPWTYMVIQYFQSKFGIQWLHHPFAHYDFENFNYKKRKCDGLWKLMWAGRIEEINKRIRKLNLNPSSLQNQQLCCHYVHHYVTIFVLFN